MYTSPLFCGTINERKMLRAPTEIHSKNHLEPHLKKKDDDSQALTTQEV